MTPEQRILFGLEEIKAIVFECTECGARSSIKPGISRKPPYTCPSGHAWDWDVSVSFSSTESPFRALFGALARLPDLTTGKTGFKMYLEIERPKD
jgi:hypothetical protein